MSQQTEPIRISGAGDLIAAVPYLLGFTPESSLVIVGLAANGLQCTFRVDLPERTEDARALHNFSSLLTRNGCSQAVAIVYGSEPIAEAIMAVTARRLKVAGIDLLDANRVDHDRYWSLVCDGPCCPDEGRTIPHLPEAVLELITAGAATSPDRESVAAQLDPAEPESRAAVEAAVAEVSKTEPLPDAGAARRVSFEYLVRWLNTTELPGPADIAELGLLLGTDEIRDVLCLGIDDRPDQARLDLWIWLVRHLSDQLLTGAATVAGWAAYRTGNGVIALEAFDLALRADPRNDCARWMRQALQTGVPPKDAAAWIGLVTVVDEVADRA
jgi:hypothetical protein